MSAEIHVGDIGTKIRATILDGDQPAPLQAATVQQFLLHKPSGTIITVSTSFTSDGSDGKIEYTSDSGTFDEAGFYKIQAYIEVGTKHWHTETVSFRVYPNLN